MAITEKTVFVTDDGEVHQTREEAEAHDLKRELAANIYSEFAGSTNSDLADDLADWLLTNYTMTPKGK